MADKNDQVKEQDNDTLEVKPAQKYTKPRKVFLTLLLFSSQLCVGMSTSLSGPTFIHMRELLETDTIKLSLAQSLRSVGVLCGSLLGGIFFKRFPAEVQFLLLLVVRCIVILLLPWSPSVYVFMVLQSVYGLITGYFGTGCHPYIFCLWKGSNIAKSMIQGLFFAFAIGNTIGPLIAKPFLHELNLTYVNISQVNTSANWEPGNYETVRYPYTIVGVLYIPIIITFIAVIINYGKKHGMQKESLPSKGPISNDSIIPVWYQWSFFALLATSGACTSIVVMVSSGFMSLFVVEGLGWSVQEGAVLTTVYWAASTLGRIPAIPLVYYIPVKILLFVSYLVTCICYTVMLFITQLPEYTMTILTAVCGLGMCSVMGNLTIWGLQQPIPKHRVSASFIMGTSMGGIIAYPIIGSLLETMGPMWYVYSFLVTSALLIVLFLLMNMQIKCYKIRQPVEEYEHVTSTINN